MSVVQRCPNCGTTKATAGECEACHEAQVRYFCTNHTPGLWLKASTCPKCGARLGDAARDPSIARPIPERTRSPAAAPATPPRTRSRAAARASTPAPPHPYSRPAPRETRDSESGSHKRWSPAEEERFEPRVVPLPLWQMILQAAARARYMPSRTRYRERTPAIGRMAGGCVKRLLVGMLLLFLALGTAVFVFGRALFAY
jgi:hypothetical protein